jgi:hypothetical protein
VRYYRFSSAFSIDPTPSTQEYSTTDVIRYEEGDLDNHEPYTGYNPEDDPIKPTHDTPLLANTQGNLV